MAERKSTTPKLSWPVLVGTVPLFAVTSLVVNEGYKTAAVAGSRLMQMLAPTAKSITIEALLVAEHRALKPPLEALALTSRVLAAAAGPVMALSGVPVVTKNSVHLDMQITSLVFTQDSQMRDTLRVTISLTHVPRTQLGAAIGGALDLALAAGTPFI
jgi:citrate lyase gamma subunit